MALFLFGIIKSASELVTIFDHINTGNWTIVNDDVMGGASESLIRFSEDRKLTFSGFLSLENNGGFASTRMDLGDLKLNDCESVSMRFRGDGKQYKVQLITDHLLNDIRYTFEFRTIRDVWMEITIPMREFRPTYRGRTIADAGIPESKNIRRVGLLISDKQAGQFSLTVDWIKCL